MTKRLSAFVAVFATSAMLLFTGGNALAAPPTVDVNQQVPITGTLPGGGAFDGTFDLDRIVGRGDVLTAVGTLSGTLTDAEANVIGTVTDVPLSLALQQATGSCEILDLVLGPLDLDLLGLVVHLDTVHLNITAEQGSGNLLGNLLCAVAGLLDNSASPNAIAQLLNRILGLLG